MCVALTAPSILCHASSILSSSAWSSFLGFVCWIYNLMHCFLDLLRSKMASWLSREGAGVAGLVHVWNPLVNHACCLKNCTLHKLFQTCIVQCAYWTYKYKSTKFGTHWSTLPAWRTALPLRLLTLHKLFQTSIVHIGHISLKLCL